MIIPYTIIEMDADIFSASALYRVVITVEYNTIKIRDGFKSYDFSSREVVYVEVE